MSQRILLLVAMDNEYVHLVSIAMYMVDFVFFCVRYVHAMQLGKILGYLSHHDAFRFSKNAVIGFYRVVVAGADGLVHNDCSGIVSGTIPFFAHGECDVLRQTCERQDDGYGGEDGLFHLFDWVGIKKKCSPRGKGST